MSASDAQKAFIHLQAAVCHSLNRTVRPAGGREISVPAPAAPPKKSAESLWLALGAYYLAIQNASDADVLCPGVAVGQSIHGPQIVPGGGLTWLDVLHALGDVAALRREHPMSATGWNRQAAAIEAHAAAAVEWFSGLGAASGLEWTDARTWREWGKLLSQTPGNIRRKLADADRQRLPGNLIRLRVAALQAFYPHAVSRLPELNR